METVKIIIKKLLVLGFFVLVFVWSNSASAELLANWNFEEGSGNIAYDPLGGHDGQIRVNTVYSSDAAIGNYSLDFGGGGSGSGVYVNSVIAAAGTLTESTSSMWVKYDGSITADAALLVGSWSPGSQFSALRPATGVGPGPELFWGQVSNYYIYDNATPNADTWYNIVQTYAADNTFRLYINGVLKAVAGGNSSNMWYGPIGFGGPGFGPELNGHMDDIAIFNTQLSDGGVSVGEAALPGSEIYTLYNQGAAAVPEPATMVLFGLGSLALLRRKR